MRESRIWPNEDGPGEEEETVDDLPKRGRTSTNKQGSQLAVRREKGGGEDGRGRSSPLQPRCSLHELNLSLKPRLLLFV